MNIDKYNKAVSKCRALVRRKNELKYEIVKLALSVCIIKEGNSNSYRNYTLTAFARDIGVAASTLTRWKLEYEKVISKIDRKGKKLNTHALEQTMKRIDAGSTKKEVQKVYDRYDTGYKNREDKTLRTYTDRLRSMHFFICYGSNLKALDKNDLEEMKMYCSDMVKCINTSKGKRTEKPTKAIEKAIQELK